MLIICSKTYFINYHDYCIFRTEVNYFDNLYFILLLWRSLELLFLNVCIVSYCVLSMLQGDNLRLPIINLQNPTYSYLCSTWWVYSMIDIPTNTRLSTPGWWGVELYRHSQTQKLVKIGSCYDVFFALIAKRLNKHLPKIFFRDNNKQRFILIWRTKQRVW